MSEEFRFDYGDLEVSERVLLGRIDERLKTVESRLSNIETKLISTSEHETLLRSVREHEQRIDEIHDWKTTLKTQILIYSSMAVIIGGLLVSIVSDFIRDLFV